MKRFVVSAVVIVAIVAGLHVAHPVAADALVRPSGAEPVTARDATPGLDECPVLRDTTATDASVTVASVELGGGSTITQTRNANGEYDVEGDAEVKIGGHLVFGEHSSAVGEGVSADLAAGISLGAGLGYDHLAVGEDQTLAEEFQQGNLTSVQANQPSTVSVDAGVWLNGSVDIAAPGGGQASLEGEATAAIGYVLDLEYDKQGTPSVKTQAVTFSASGSVSAQGDLQLLKAFTLGAAGTLDAEAELSINFDPNFNLTGFEADLTGTATWSTTANLEGDFEIKDLQAKLGGTATDTHGNAIEYITKLDTSTNPAATAALDHLMAAMLDTNGAPPPSQSDIDAAVATLNPYAHSMLFDSAVIEHATAADLKAGADLGFALEGSTTHTQRKTVAAWWAPTGSSVMIPWTDCDNALLHGMTDAPTTTTTVPVPPSSTTTTSPTPPISTPTTVPQPTHLVVSVDGHIGSLQIGRSTEDDVRHALGPPDAVGVSNVGLPQVPEFRALGYGCTTTPGTWPSLNGSRGGAPYCQTVYYLYASNHVLGAFWTASPKYQTVAGTTVGMTEAEAQSREHASVTVGCNVGITLGHAATTAQVYIDVDATPTAPVSDLAVDATHNPIGIKYC